MKSKLFLTELMISIFFFSVLTAFCVQLFAEAYSMSEGSEKLTHAVTKASNVAEYYDGWDFSKENWQIFFSQGKWDGDTWQVSFDKEWEACAEDGCYLLTVSFRNEDGFCEAYITVEDEQGGEIYSLMTKRIYGEG